MYLRWTDTLEICGEPFSNSYIINFLFEEYFFKKENIPFSNSVLSHSKILPSDAKLQLMDHFV